MILFTGAGWLFLWLDLLLGHASAGLKHPAMWLPLVFLPFAIVLSFMAAWRASSASRRLFACCCYGAVALGAVGFGFHLSRLLHDLKGAVQWDVLVRLMRYPPLLAPLAVSGLGVLGLLTLREEEEAQ